MLRGAWLVKFKPFEERYNNWKSALNLSLMAFFAPVDDMYCVMRLVRKDRAIK